jgi:hypothetical protein
MELPTGIWDVYANNNDRGQFNIVSIDAQGKVSGTVFGNQIFGFWDDVAKKLTFMRIINSADPSTFQIYTGYYFRNRPGEGYRSYTLTGFFEAFSGTGATAQRSLYGWYARLQTSD